MAVRRSPGKKRKRRAGGDNHPSGNYVRRKRPDGDGRGAGADYEVDHEAVTHTTRKPVTLPVVKWNGEVPE
jgi:hypothetical protein